MALDTSIALQTRPAKIDSPLEAQSKALTLRNLMGASQLQDMQLQEQQQQFQRTQQLRSLIGAIPATASDDARIGALRAGGFFDEADKLQTGILARDKSRAETGHLAAQTGKLTTDTAATQRSKAIQDIAAFETPEQARQSLIAHVQAGDLDPQLGSMIHSSIPQDMGAFRQWQLSMLRRIMSAQEAAGQLTPKLQTMNLGGTEQVIDLNPNTRGAAPSTFRRTQTPDSVASNATTQRGQDMTDARQRELNAITKEGQQTQVVNDPNLGIVLVNKGTKIAVPAVSPTGEPIPSEAQAAQAKLAGQLSEGIAMARQLIPQATASGVGSLVDKGAGFVGATTPGAQAASQLETLAGWMTANVPRMQGPQSDKDVLLYRQMAGQVGDSSMPAARRLAALDTLEQLQAKYSALSARSPLARGAVVPIKSDADYGALPSGTRFKAPDGTIRVKP